MKDMVSTEEGLAKARELQARLGLRDLEAKDPVRGLFERLIETVDGACTDCGEIGTRWVYGRGEFCRGCLIPRLRVAVKCP